MRSKERELQLIAELMKAWCEDWGETYITGYYSNHDITYDTTDDGEEIPRDRTGGGVWDDKKYGDPDRIEYYLN